MSLAEFSLVMVSLSLLWVLVLDFEFSDLKSKFNELDKETRVTRTQDKYYKENIDSLAKRIDQNAYSIRQLSESCGQIDDLEIKAKINQKDIERTLDMIDELKAKRSMDVLDELREEDKK